MDTLSYLSLLRSIHVITGTFWVGATLYLAWFILPAVKATGPEGGKFMQQLTRTNKLPAVMTLVSLLNILSGLLLIHKLSAGFEYTWFTSRHGILVAAGAAFAITAFIEGFLITRPNAEKLARLSRSIASSGLSPTENEIQQLTGYRHKIVTVIKQSAILLTLSIIVMSLVHYL